MQVQGIESYYSRYRVIQFYLGERSCLLFLYPGYSLDFTQVRRFWRALNIPPEEGSELQRCVHIRMQYALLLRFSSARASVKIARGVHDSLT